LDRHKAFIDALFEAWSALGAVVEVTTRDLASFLEEGARNDGIDVRIARWGLDYEDPDGMLGALFDSRRGRARAYHSSAELDAELEAARVEPEPSRRAALYRAMEESLLRSSRVLPLWHDIDCRLVASRVKNVTMSASPPWVGYASLHIAAERAASLATASRGGTLYVPVAERLDALDPCVENRSEPSAILTCVFETLTREVKGARIVPWLASSIEVEDGARRFHFRLREGVHFHDSRRLTARDVRWSFEYLLRNAASQARGALSPIAGARRVLSGEAHELSGFEIHSPTEFTIQLEEPLVFFPALVSQRNVAIVPEGTTTFGTSFRDGCVGTGPFRVLRFEPGKRVELEANPQYWRAGQPKSDAITYVLGVSPAEAMQRLRAGQVSLASSLVPADVEALRQDASFGGAYRETPTLSTYALFFNVSRGAFASATTRQSAARATR
jgi:ABC-type transport system substrate-binding protein